MNNPLDDAMEGMARDAARQDRLARRRVHFQELVVKTLLRRLGLQKAERHLRQLCYDQTGEDFLLFSWFQTVHPDFPVWLGARNCPVADVRRYEDQAWKPAKEGRPTPVTRTRLFRHLDGLRETAPEGWDGPVGLVFRWWHHHRPLKILHTADLPLVGYRQQVRIETADGPEVVTLEDFETFLRATRWSP